MNTLKKFNQKKILTYALLLILVIFIVILTWIPLIFDVNHLDINKWITTTLINVGIMVCAIILGEMLGEDRQINKVDGLYQQALKKYNDLLYKLTNERKIIIYFSQFYIWFKALELKRKKESYLVDNGFDQTVASLIVKYINRDDIEEMRHRVVVKLDEDTKKEIKFRKIHDDEYEILKVIYSPEFQIDVPKYTYYLSAFGDSSSVSTLEQAKRIEHKERLNKTFNRVFKILLAVFISLIWGMATVQELNDGATQEAIINTIIRLFSLISGLLSGYMTSVVTVKLSSQKIENKVQVLTFMEIYYDSKEFIPKTYEEIVEEELKKEEEEKAKYITPDIVEPHIQTANNLISYDLQTKENDYGKN